MAVERLVSLLLRAAELAFAAIVTGVTGQYLDRSNASSHSLWRFIYTISVSALSMLLSLLWLIPVASTFTHWPVDLFISVAWWVVFGILVDWLNGSCGPVFDWANISPRGDQCGKFKADVAFAFLSALMWLVSALFGFFWLREHAAGRTWYRRSRV